MIPASGSLLGRPLGALCGPLGGFLGRIGAVLGVWERSFAGSEAARESAQRTLPSHQNTRIRNSRQRTLRAPGDNPTSCIEARWRILRSFFIPQAMWAPLRGGDCSSPFRGSPGGQRRRSGVPNRQVQLSPLPTFPSLLPLFLVLLLRPPPRLPPPLPLLLLCLLQSASTVRFVHICARPCGGVPSVLVLLPSSGQEGGGTPAEHRREFGSRRMTAGGGRHWAHGLPGGGAVASRRCIALGRPRWLPEGLIEQLFERPSRGPKESLESLHVICVFLCSIKLSCFRLLRPHALRRPHEP